MTGGSAQKSASGLEIPVHSPAMTRHIPYRTERELAFLRLR
jgi:hypothetical protein